MLKGKAVLWREEKVKGGTGTDLRRASRMAAESGMLIGLGCNPLLPCVCYERGMRSHLKWGLLYTHTYVYTHASVLVRMAALTSDIH